MAWYDTAHMHVFTHSLDHFLHTWIAVPLPPEGVVQILYSTLMKGVTLLGGNLIFVIVVGVVLVDLFKKKDRETFATCLILVLGVFTLSQLFKHLIYSPRPVPFSMEHNSFPSGHTMRSTLWCGLFLLLHQLKVIKLPRYWVGILVSIPLLVGFSRLALSRHWISDLLGAYALTLFFIFLIYGFLLKVKKN
jgi:undecaprenyl-diphosphatase